MKMRIFSVVLLVVVLLAFPVMSACAKPAPKPAPAPKPTPKEVPTVVVGSIQAITGPASATHLWCDAGPRDYLKYVNDVKGGIEGKKGKVKVEVITYDSEYSASKAKDGFAKLMGQGMILHTHCASGHSDALMTDYEAAKIPLVTGSLGVASPWSDWAYSVFHPGCMNLTRTWMKWAKSEWEKAGRPGGSLVLGAVQADEPWVPLMVYEIDPFLKEEGITFVQEVVPKGATDYTPQLLRLKNAGCYQIASMATAPGTSITLKSAKTMGLEIPLVQTGACELTDVIAIAGPELAEGYIGESFFEAMGQAPEIPRVPGLKLAEELFAKHHPGELVRGAYIYGIVAGMVIEEAIRLALDEVTPEQLTGETLKIHGLDQVRDFDAGGIVAPISYVEGDHLGQKHAKFYQVRNALLYPVSDWVQSTTYRMPREK